MKKIFCFILSALALASCNFLDFDETSGVYTREDMYKTYSDVRAMLSNVYSYMPQDFGVLGDAMRDCGSDDAEFGDPDASVQRFNNGNWSAKATVDTKWNLFNGIRCANEFLESYPKVDLSIYRFETSYDKNMAHFVLFPYEARVLRAWYLFELARRYGDIPMPLKMLTIEEANSIEKTPFDEVVNFIAEECDTCAKYLPLDYNGLSDNEVGRVTKGFAMAVKSKALLYAASKLHNPTMDAAKWEAAAKAAMDIIDLGIYTLDPGEKCNNVNSSEAVLLRMNSESQDFELYNFPIRFTLGKRTFVSGTYPTQNLVDAFQTKNGYDITLTANGWQTSDPAFDISKPYENRDPRFARTVLANGMTFKGSKIETFVGGADYAATRDKGTPTGYYLRKYIQETTDFTPEALVSTRHQWIIYRYAETLLSYAEAMTEAFGDPAHVTAELPLSAADALNQVRANAGMPAVTVTGKDAFIEAVRREWRVEFAFEDHRFWDVRRWCIGSTTQTQIDGVSIVPSGEKLDYFRKMVEKRIWADRMNLYPIPQAELFCNTNLNPQNNGW